jgi:hypothetical protein
MRKPGQNFCRAQKKLDKASKMREGVDMTTKQVEYAWVYDEALRGEYEYVFHADGTVTCEGMQVDRKVALDELQDRSSAVFWATKLDYATVRREYVEYVKWCKEDEVKEDAGY